MQTTGYNALARGICDEFKLDESALPRVSSTLAYLDAERFALPYAAGQLLAMRRPHGLRLREAAAGPLVDAPSILPMDADACDMAWMLEIVDRCGITDGLRAIVEAMMTDNADIDVGQYPFRTEPVDPQEILPMVRESAATLFRELTGKVPSDKRDLARKRNKVVLVPGRPAAFMLSMLRKSGWPFTAADIARKYVFMSVKRPRGK